MSEESVKTTDVHPIPEIPILVYGTAASKNNTMEFWKNLPYIASEFLVKLDFWLKRVIT